MKALVKKSYGFADDVWVHYISKNIQDIRWATIDVDVYFIWWMDEITNIGVMTNAIFNILDLSKTQT